MQVIGSLTYPDCSWQQIGQAKDGETVPEELAPSAMAAGQETQYSLMLLGGGEGSWQEQLQEISTKASLGADGGEGGAGGAGGSGLNDPEGS